MPAALVGAHDLWSLVHASASLDGFLFSEARERLPCGRRPLGEADVAAIVDRRRTQVAMAFPELAEGR